MPHIIGIGNEANQQGNGNMATATINRRNAAKAAFTYNDTVYCADLFRGNVIGVFGFNGPQRLTFAEDRCPKLWAAIRTALLEDTHAAIAALNA